MRQIEACLQAAAEVALAIAMNGCVFIACPNKTDGQLGKPLN